MRLLLVTYEYPPVGGGLGKAVRAIGRELAAMGHEVTVLTSRFGDAPARERDGELHLRRIPVFRQYQNHARAWEVLSFAASGMLRARGLVRELQPGATVAFLTIPSGAVAEAMRWAGGPQWVNFLRGQDVPGYPDTPRWMHRVAWPVTGFLWRRAARTLANSEGLAALAHRSAPAMPIAIVPNGIDTARYCPATTPSPRSRLRVTYCGRLVRSKGLHELLEAWRLVVDARPGTTELVLAGTGPERAALEERAARLELGDSVAFAGQLDEEALLALLRESDMFVNPSEGEGMPNAVLEAMACGLPVVLSPIRPHEELLVGVEGGVLADPADAGAFGLALGELLDDADRRRLLGVQARAVVERHFGWRTSAERLLASLAPDQSPR